jgi:hypothetical protein
VVKQSQTVSKRDDQREKREVEDLVAKVTGIGIQVQPSMINQQSQANTRPSFRCKYTNTKVNVTWM